MTNLDPAACRRALREIGEIAAVAVLPDSRMTEQEALQTIPPSPNGSRRIRPENRPDAAT